MTRVGRALVALAGLLSVLAIFAVWADRQLLDDRAWDDTSSALLENAAVRAEIAGFLVDELYVQEDVSGQIEALLPPRAAPLAGPAAMGLRELAERGTARLLGRPRIQDIWRDANRRAHAELVRAVEGEGSAGGDVVLDLRELLEATQQRVGVGGAAAQALPAGAAQITILRADRLGTAQDLVDLFETLVVALCALTIALGLLAFALARGRRRETLRACGTALVAAGAAVLLGRGLAGTALVDALGTSDAVRPAAHTTWTIATSLLAEIAGAVVLYGVVVVLAAWLAGPTRWALTVRGAVAPYLAEARLAYGAVAVVGLLVLAWGPTPATRHAVPMLALAALLALGVTVLRRQTAREARSVTRLPSPGSPS
jgi:hypothetical protein